MSIVQHDENRADRRADLDRWRGHQQQRPLGLIIRSEVPGEVLVGVAAASSAFCARSGVLCGIADVSTQSEEPVTKHLVVEVTPAQES